MCWGIEEKMGRNGEEKPKRKTPSLSPMRTWVLPTAPRAYHSCAAMTVLHAEARMHTQARGI